jgi:hypothetical protein
LLRNRVCNSAHQTCADVKASWSGAVSILSKRFVAAPPHPHSPHLEPPVLNRAICGFSRNYAGTYFSLFSFNFDAPGTYLTKTCFDDWLQAFHTLPMVRASLRFVFNS